MKIPGHRTYRVLIILLATLIVVFNGACSTQPRYDSPPISGNDVVIDIPSLPLEIPVFYTHQVKNKKVSFFLLKLNNGVFAFFDACVSCNPHRRGYAYKDGQVICRSCNMNFSIYKLEKGLGGCFPIKIEGEVKGTNYRIPLSLIENRADTF